VVVLLLWLLFADRAVGVLRPHVDFELLLGAAGLERAAEFLILSNKTATQELDPSLLQSLVRELDAPN
jgi:hypothetical protein